MTLPPTPFFADSPSAEVARTILDGFDRHYRLFREVAHGAKARWETGDWAAVREASRMRIDMYDARVREGVEAVRARFPMQVREEALWPAIKRAYVSLLTEHLQPECAETFFNSVSTRILDRNYFENNYLFRRPAISTEHLEAREPTYTCHYPGTSDLRECFWDILHGFRIAIPFRSLAADLDAVVRALDAACPELTDRQPNFQLHVLSSLFFRNKAAYVVGRVINGETITPFVLPVLRTDDGKAFVDALLLDRVNIGRVFSLGRAYFMVDMDVPSAYVDFLRTIVPSKPRAELYTVVGLQKQGKTLFYRDLLHHLKHSTDRFVLAPGTKGMVMLVFTLPSYPYVFKVIRDDFAPPKETDRRYVEGRYRFVKLHDRVGRMADTLEFSYVQLPRERFDKGVLDELRATAPSILQEERDQVVIGHVYIERRLEPLDLALQRADDAHARAMLDEYGKALAELAGANIFPGDLLIKNFGVTRYGRVVFYDYDELCELTDCRFRSMPKPRHEDDEMRSEPFYDVGAHDVFPEQFPTFLLPEGAQRELLLELHPEIKDPRWWSAAQERLKQGLQDDIFPYEEEVRFHHAKAPG